MAIVLDGTTGITTPGINNTGTSTFAAGSAAAPSIAPTGDPNTGMFFPAADTIAFSEGGTEAMRLTSTGNVGIGTTSPAGKLDIGGSSPDIRITASGGATGQLIADKNSFDVGPLTSHPLILITNATERFQIGASGQLGIGGANYGTSGQVLTSNGAASAPSWQLPAGLPTMNIVSGTTQAAVANNHYVLTNASATTVTLPASPAAGAVVWVTVANGLTTNVIARNGQNINSIAQDMTIDNAYAGVQLRYADATRGWVFT